MEQSEKLLDYNRGFEAGLKSAKLIDFETHNQKFERIVNDNTNLKEQIERLKSEIVSLNDFLSTYYKKGYEMGFNDAIDQQKNK